MSIFPFIHFYAILLVECREQFFIFSAEHWKVALGASSQNRSADLIVANLKILIHVAVRFKFFFAKLSKIHVNHKFIDNIVKLNRKQCTKLMILQEHFGHRLLKRQMWKKDIRSVFWSLQLQTCVYPNIFEIMMVKETQMTGNVSDT